MRLFGREKAGGSDIRILSPRAATETAVTAGNVVRQEAPRKLSPLIRPETSREAVRMVVKQEMLNQTSDGISSSRVSPPVIQNITTSGPVPAAAAMQSMQPKIDVNRLTDEVYRMLERRLITERERRGR